jgi:hypothetical protein
MLLAAVLLADVGGKPADYPKLQEPLRYGRDLVEVTGEGTLRRWQ